MPTDLEGELDVLGTWLQRHQETITGGRIRATVGSRRLASGSPDPVEVVLDDAVPGGPGGPGGRVAARPDRRHPIRRTSWLVAAAIVLVCLAAGTFLALTRPGSAPASLPTGPTDPTGALYVMPSAGSAAPTRNATSMAAAVAPSRARGAVVGVPDGDWYRGVVTIAVVDERPEPAGAGGWQQVDRTSGPALTSSDGVMSRDSPNSEGRTGSSSPAGSTVRRTRWTSSTRSTSTRRAASPRPRPARWRWSARSTTDRWPGRRGCSSS